MAKLTFILGGARSGKSSHAVKLAKKYKKVVFVATCKALDKEMKKRINLHKKSRPCHWRTIEEDKNIVSALSSIKDRPECIIIDCLTLLVSNLLLSGGSGKEIEKKINNIISTLKKLKLRTIIISNEVGLGIVPRNKLAREFRDVAGRANQIMASLSDEVFFMVSGLAWRIK